MWTGQEIKQTGEKNYGKYTIKELMVLCSTLAYICSETLLLRRKKKTCSRWRYRIQKQLQRHCTEKF